MQSTKFTAAQLAVELPNLCVFSPPKNQIFTIEEAMALEADKVVVLLAGEDAPASAFIELPHEGETPHGQIYFSDQHGFPSPIYVCDAAGNTIFRKGRSLLSLDELVA